MIATAVAAAALAVPSAQAHRRRAPLRHGRYSRRPKTRMVGSRSGARTATSTQSNASTTPRAQRQTFEIARRLHRGERLYEEATG